MRERGIKKMNWLASYDGILFALVRKYRKIERSINIFRHSNAQKSLKKVRLFIFQ